MIVFEGVTKIYDPNVVALRDTSFVIEKGEFVFLVGPPGSGKSTIMRLLLKELDPTRGRIFVGGRELARLKRSKSRCCAATSASSRTSSPHRPHGVRERLLRAQGAGPVEDPDPGQGARDPRPRRPRSEDEQLPARRAVSASRSRARSSTIRRCSSATSPRATSTPTPPSGSCSSSPHQPHRYHGGHGHARPRDGRQDAQARHRPRGRRRHARRATGRVRLSRNRRARLFFTEASARSPRTSPRLRRS